MKGLFKRLSVLAASLAMVFGVGLVNNEKNAKAAGESTYVKVTEAPTDWTGEYVLVYESSATSAYVWTGVDASSCYETTTITDSKITLAPTAKLNIASMTGGYSIKIIGGTNDGKYIGGTKNKNTINFSNSSILNTIAYSSSAVAITSNSTTMKYNSAIGQERFRYYISGQSAVQLYKLDESSIDPNESKITLDLSSSMMKVEATLTLNAETSGTGTTITWESSDINVATVADGVVTALKAGTTTITATFGTASASCKILVNPEHSGTSANDPLTIAEAKAAIDAGFTSEVYVKGIITNKEYNSSYFNYEKVYVVDSTDDTTNTFIFFRMKDIDGANFASDTLVVGETIIVCGNLQKHGSDYELGKDCYLVKKIEKEISIIVVSGIDNGDVYYVGDSIEANAITVTAMYEDDTEAEITDYTINPELPYTLTSSDVGSKTFTITYKELSDTFTITVKEKPTDAKLSTININEGENVKKKYYVGESVDTTGLTVTAGYESASDSKYTSFVDVTDKVTWTLDTTVANTEAKLTASFTDGDVTETAFITVVVEETASLSDVYDLVTDVNKLSENDMIVIAAQVSSFAMNTTQNKNNRSASSITKSENSITASDDTQRIILKKGTKDNTFALSVEDGFLYAASSSNNYLKTEDTLSDNSSWTITITSTGVATIKAQGTYNHNILKYNSSSKLFSCYTGGQADVVIYKYYASADAKNLVKTIEDADTCTDYVNVNTYLTSYNNLSSEGKIFVGRSFISDISLDGEPVEITCRTKLDFMSARYEAQQGSSNAKFNLYSSSTTSVSFVLIIGIIGLGSILGYYFINKKRMLSK